MFGFFKKREKIKSEDFIGSVKGRDTKFLLQAYSYLDADMQVGRYTDRTVAELQAVEEELVLRGLVHMRDF